MMKINKLTLENFQRFRKRTVIDFNENGTGDLFNIIHADNGKGKSTLFYALGWAFDEDFKVYDDFGDDKTSQMGLRPDSCVKDRNFSENQILTEVTINFETEYFSFNLKRSAYTRKDQAEDFWPLKPRKNEFECRVTDKRKPEEPPKTIIEPELYAKYLDKRAIQYFIFDGDHSASTFLKKNDELSNAAGDLLKLKPAKLTAKWLKKLHEKLESIVSRSTEDEDVNQAQDDVDLFVGQNETLDGEVDALQEKVNTRSAAHKSLLNRYSKVKEIIEWKESVLEAKTAREQLSRAEKGFKKELGKVNHLSWIMLSNHNSIDCVIAEFNARTADGATQPIPRMWTNTLVQSLMEGPECICGRPLIEDSKEVEKLKGMIEPGADEFSNKLNGLKGEIDNARSAAKNSFDNLKSLRDEIKELATKAFEADDDERKAKSKIPQDYSEEGGADVNLASEVGRANEQLKSAEIEFDNKKEDLQSNNQKLRKAEEVLKALQKDKVQDEKALAHMNFAEQALNVIEEASASVEQIAIKLIAEKANDIKGKYLGEEDDRYVIKIGDDFTVACIDRETEQVYENKDRVVGSRGQTMMAGYSILFALSQVAGKGVMPFVVDNFFSSLSSKSMKKVAASLGKIFGQIIVFSHDGDFPKVVRDHVVENFQGDVAEWTIGYHFKKDVDDSQLHLLEEGFIKSGYQTKYF